MLHSPNSQHRSLGAVYEACAGGHADVHVAKSTSNEWNASKGSRAPVKLTLKYCTFIFLVSNAKAVSVATSSG